MQYKIRVYVAGAYSSPTLIGALDNMRRGMQLAFKVLKAGFSPFVPWFDYHFSLIGDVTIEEYQGYCLPWIEVSDAMLIVPEGVEESNGTQAELKLAEELGIPIFYSLKDLQEWSKGWKV